MFKRLGEYIKLVPKALKNPKEVVEGMINHVKATNGSLPEDEQEEIVRRRLICSGCKFNSIEAKNSEEYFQAYGVHYETERPDLHCSCCACNIDWKTASLAAECGLKYYNDTHENQIPLKWEAYKK
jgi:hypothetical protein